MVNFSRFFHEFRESFAEILFLISIGKGGHFIFINRTFYIQTRMFYIILKILSFDFPKKKYERRIIAGFSLLGDGGSPPTVKGMGEVPNFHVITQ